MPSVGQRKKRPSLAFLCPALGRSSEAWMLRQLCGLSRLDVRVFTRAHAGPSEPASNKVPVTMIPNRLAATNDVPLINRVGQAARAAELLAYLVRHRPQVALVQFGTFGVSVLPALRAARIPTVVHFHAHDLSKRLSDPVYERRLRKALPRLAGAVVVAGYQRDWLLDHGMGSGRVHVIPCGVPVAEMQPAVDVTVQPCRFVAVGRLVEKKAPLHLIRAFAHCARRCEGVELDVIGEGPLRASARKLAEDLAIGSKVTFHGATSNDVVRRTLARSAVFVQHSLTSADGDREGWPVSIAEAAASGLPIVSTRHAEIPTQVVEGKTGYLVDEGDWEKMGEVMARLAEAPQMRKRLGKAGYFHIRKFDTTGQIEQLEDVLLNARCVDGRS